MGQGKSIAPVAVVGAVPRQVSKHSPRQFRLVSASGAEFAKVLTKNYKDFGNFKMPYLSS